MRGLLEQHQAGVAVGVVHGVNKVATPFLRVVEREVTQS